MSERDAAIAVLLRSAQWELDEAAFKASGGRLTRTDCAVLAHKLGALSTAVNRYGEALVSPRGADRPG